MMATRLVSGSHPSVCPVWLGWLKKRPLLNREGLQDPVPHGLAVLDPLRLAVLCRRVRIFARVMWHVDGDDDVGALLLEPQEKEVDVRARWPLATRVGIGRGRGLDKGQAVDRMAAVRPR